MIYKKIPQKDSLHTVIILVLCIAVLAAAFCFSKLYDSPKSDGGSDTQNLVRIIDVGQGDGILIKSGKYSALIDTGTPDAYPKISSELKSLGVNELDVLLITHLDSDHCGAAPQITENIKVNNLILPEISVESEGLYFAEASINQVKQKNGNIYSAVQGMNFDIGDFQLTVLAAFSEMTDDNNRSAVTAAEIDGLRFLFTGDIEKKAETELLKENLDLKCDVLKVAHHGSRGSSSYAFLEKSKPEYAAISVGADNGYGHPHKETINALEKIGAKVFRTDLSGDITFVIENGKILPETER